SEPGMRGRGSWSSRVSSVRASLRNAPSHWITSRGRAIESSASDHMAAESGSPRALDHYRLERRLAVGGMAEVWLAADQRSGRPGAIKKILPQIATDEAVLERFFHKMRVPIAP